MPIRMLASLVPESVVSVMSEVETGAIGMAPVNVPLCLTVMMGPLGQVS